MSAITPEAAERIARQAHAGVDDRHGIPYICHVERVAAAAPEHARAVAWLHDTVEDTSVSSADLADAGASPEQLRALELVTRPAELTYMDYVRRLAAGPGPAGAIARAVKHADLHDNLNRPRTPEMDGIERRYLRALKIVHGAMTAAGELPGAGCPDA